MLSMAIPGQAIAPAWCEGFAADKAGADGVVVYGNERYEDKTLFVAFDPAQIKSSISNPGGFATAHNEASTDSMNSEKPNHPDAQHPQAPFDPRQSTHFGEWFKDSVVVDEDGTPQVVFHGSGSYFKTFETPSYFSDYEEDANEYSGANYGISGGVVYPVYLSIQNAKDLGDAFDSSTDALTTRRIKYLKSQGYDGARGRDGNTGATHWIAFDPEQIKSSISIDDDMSDSDKHLDGVEAIDEASCQPAPGG